MEVPVKQRIQRVKQEMEEQSVDLMMLVTGANMKYLTGFEAKSSGRHMVLVVPRDGDPEFFTPQMVREEVKETGLKATFWDDDQDVVDEFVSFLGKFDGNRVLLDDKMWELFSRDVKRVLDTEFGLASEIMDGIRAVKTEDEIDRIRRASEIADSVFEDLRDKDIVGMKEIELKEFIENRMRELGGHGPSFDTIVASGPNGSKPHHVSSERIIENGDPVVLDFGCWVDGYPSDQTRTIVAGGQEPSEKFREVFQIVKEAQQKGIRSVSPGVQDKYVDDVVREVIEKAGYGDEFIHRTGHGVGVEIHESPKIPPKNHETKMKLQPGMVFSVEPGIYIEGEFGVRIEDLVLVTEEGFERLNKTGNDWYS